MTGSVCSVYFNGCLLLMVLLREATVVDARNQETEKERSFYLGSLLTLITKKENSA